MDRAVEKWSRQYYGTGLGAPMPLFDLTGDQDEFLTGVYQQTFLEPLTYMLTGQTDELSVSPQNLNSALMKISSGKITDWLYLLEYWVNEGYFVYTGDFDKDLEECYNRFKSCYVVFVTFGVDCTDIALHKCKGRIIDKLPGNCNFVQYPQTLKVHRNGKMLFDLSNRAPTLVTADERVVLDQAVTQGLLPEYKLRREKVLVPIMYGQQVVPQEVTALSVDCPPAGYVELSNTIAQSMVKEHGNVFLAIKAYIESGHEVAKEVRDYVESISNCTNLCDNDIIEYLNRHGINCTSIEDIQNALAAQSNDNTNNTDHTIIYDADVEIWKSVEDMFSAYKDGKVEEISVDEYILKTCEDAGLSKQITIDQFIEYLNTDATPEPMSVKDMIVKEMADKKISDETTFAEYLKGEKHRSKDEAAITMEFINGNEFIPEALQKELINSIVEAVPVDITKVVGESELEDFKKKSDITSKSMKAAIATLINTGKYDALDGVVAAYFESPDRTPYFDKDLCKKIVDAIMTKTPMSTPGNPRLAAMDIIPELGLDDELASRIMIAIQNNTKVEMPEVETVVALDEPGYIAGEYMLKRMRELISKDPKCRADLVSVCLAFQRILMTDYNVDKEQVMGDLNERADRSPNVAAEIIREGLSRIQ